MTGCLLIHGYTGGPYELEPLVDYLKECTDWNIEVPILPGHGKKLSLENTTYQSWLHAAEYRFNKLAETCDEVYCIGFSMGGMIAVYLAAKYDIAKLVLLAPAGKFLCSRQLSRDFGVLIKDALKGHLKRNHLYLHYKKKMREVPIKANLEFWKLIRFSRKFLNEVKAPVLIVQGKQDHMVPYKTVYYLDQEIASKQKEIVFFDQARHMICWVDDKNILNELIHSFLVKPMAC